MASVSPESTLRILIVDDDDITRELLVGALEPFGYALKEARDGVDAWSRLHSDEYDLVITDWMMPRMNGLELCKRVRTLDRYIYLMIVTGREQFGDIVQGVAAGADDFIRKPVTPVELSARVEAIQRLMDLNERVIAQNEELRRAQSLKNDWINMIVHDLRTPLAVVHGNCELMLMKTPAELHPRIEKIRREAVRVNDMLEEMLVMAKSEEGRLTLDLSDSDLVVLLRDAAEAVRTVAETKALRIEIDPLEATLPVKMDVSLIRRVLDNLLSNAIKFGPPDSAVTLSAARKDGHVSVCVRDRGPGVPEELRERIFDKFEIGNRSARSVPQHGLGLAFCRLVIDAHGGSICCRGREGGGSVFSLQLPAKVPAGTL